MAPPLTPLASLTLPSAEEEEPPRKKRRSKWDVQAPEAPPTTAQEDTPPAEPSSAAAMAAAKLNAMLASQGKLKPSTLPYMVSLMLCFSFLIKHT